jgi:hypothetical protein
MHKLILQTLKPKKTKGKDWPFQKDRMMHYQKTISSITPLGCLELSDFFRLLPTEFKVRNVFRSHEMQTKNKNNLQCFSCGLK